MGVNFNKSNVNTNTSNDSNQTNSTESTSRGGRTLSSSSQEKTARADSNRSSHLSEIHQAVTRRRQFIDRDSTIDSRSSTIRSNSAVTDRSAAATNSPAAAASSEAASSHHSDMNTATIDRRSSDHNLNKEVELGLNEAKDLFEQEIDRAPESKKGKGKSGHTGRGRSSSTKEARQKFRDFFSRLRRSIVSAFSHGKSSSKAGSATKSRSSSETSVFSRSKSDSKRSDSTIRSRSSSENLSKRGSINSYKSFSGNNMEHTGWKDEASGGDEEWLTPPETWPAPHPEFEESIASSSGSLSRNSRPESTRLSPNLAKELKSTVKELGGKENKDQLANAFHTELSAAIAKARTKLDKGQSTTTTAAKSAPPEQTVKPIPVRAIKMEDEVATSQIALSESLPTPSVARSQPFIDVQIAQSQPLPKPSVAMEIKSVARSQQPFIDVQIAQSQPLPKPSVAVEIKSEAAPLKPKKTKSQQI